MAYNRKNKLHLIITIQSITLDSTSRGITQEWVYSNLIYPTYRVSRRTFYNYLGTPAKMEIKKFNTNHKQMQLF